MPLEGPLEFTPLSEGTKRGYRLEGVLTIGGILGRWDGVPGQNRTAGLALRRRSLYPTELRGQRVANFLVYRDS